MKVVECTQDRFVFQEESEAFQTEDRVFQRLMRFGCFLPLIVSSVAFVVWSFYAVVMRYDENVLPSLAFALLTGVVGWGGHLYLRARLRKGRGGLRYTFARNRKPIVEAHFPTGDLRPHSAMEVDEKSRLRFVVVPIGQHRNQGMYVSYHHQAILIGADGVEYLMESPAVVPLSSCLTKLLNISRVTGLPIELDGVLLPREPVEESALMDHPNGLRFTSRKVDGRFDYRISPSLRHASFSAWAVLVGLLSGSLVLAFMTLETTYKLVWIVALLGIGLWQSYWILSQVLARESLVVDEAGFVFQVNGKERTRRQLSDLIELQVLPEGPYGLWTVGLFFPGHTDLLFAHHGVLLEDARQVAIDILKVLQEQGLTVPEGQFGSRFYES